MAGQLLPWIDSGDAEGNRNSMQNFLLDGIDNSFDFNFAGGYIDVSHVKAYIYHTVSGITEAIDPVVLTGPNTIQIDPTGLAGDYLVVYRDTPKDQPLIDYSTGAVLDELNLDTANKQAVFATAEMSDRFDAINASSADAIERSFTALTIANQADDKSDIAIADSAAAVITADAAEVTAANALQVAEDAVAAATGFQTNLEFYTGNDTTSRGADWQTGTVAAPGIQRWFAGTDTASDFTIDRYNDAGVLQGSAVKVDRQTGNVTLESQLDMTSSKIVNVTDGTAAQDAVTKAQLDAQLATVDAQKIDKDGTLDFAAHQKLVDSSPTDALHAASKGYVDGSIRLTRVEGLVVTRTSASVVAISASAARVRTVAGLMRWIGATGALSLDLTTQGANGRDQAGNFQSQWAHVYIITGAAQPVACLASLSTTAPTLPSGYTEFAYCLPLRVPPTANTTPVLRCIEDTVQYSWDDSPILFSGQLTGQHPATGWANHVPPNAVQVDVNGYATFRADSAGNFDGFVAIRSAGETNNSLVWVVRQIGMAGLSDNYTPISGVMLNTGQADPQITYALGIGQGFVAVYIVARSYRFKPTV